MKKKIFIIIPVLLVVVCAVVCIFAFGGKNDKKVIDKAIKTYTTAKNINDDITISEGIRYVDKSEDVDVSIVEFILGTRTGPVSRFSTK